MSSALSSFKNNHALIYDFGGVLNTILPPIVRELEKKITENRKKIDPIVTELEEKISELEKKLDYILDEMQWHPNAISRGTAHHELQAAAAAHIGIGGQRTRRRRRN